ncbi:MAG: NUDIX hydrolase [Suipraeoptans sp.]
MNNEVKRVKRELAYHGNVIDVYQDYMEFSNGNKETWDFIHHIGAACVLPILDDGRILMVQQYRNALGRDTIEVPAGKLDSEAEDPMHCAGRELEEEAGYRCDNLEYLITIRTTVAFCDERIEVYLARNLIKTKQNLDENEFVNVRIFTLEELKELIFTGVIQDSKTVAAIFAYESKHLRDL